MALLNPPKKTTTKKPDAKPAEFNLTPEQRARVEGLAASGNTAAIGFLGGTLSGSTNITNDSGGNLSASDVVGMVASGNVGGYNVSNTSQTIGQIAAASGYTTPSQIRTIAPNLTSTSLVASNPYQNTYNPATVGYRSSLADSKGELFYKPEDAEKQAEYLMKNKPEDAGVGVTPVGDQVSIQDGLTAQQNAKNLLDQYGTAAVTQPEWREYIQTMLSAGIENINKANPTPRNPVFETAEQRALRESQSQEGQSEYKKFYDEIYEASGKAALVEQKIDIKKQLQAVQEVYQKVIDEIKANPNLPKGLAARRLTEVFEDQKFAAASLTAQLDVIEDQIDSADEDIDRQLGIYEYEQTREDKLYSRRMEQFQYMVTSGAIGGMSAAELQQWSTATGIPLSAITSMKDKLTDPTKDYGVEFREVNGSLVQITYDKKNPLDREVKTLVQGAPKATEDSKPIISGALSVTRAEIQEGASLLNASKGSDGYVNTDVYNRMLERWMMRGGLAKDFMVYYPPKMYVNPEDPTRSNAVMTQFEEKDEDIKNPFE